MPELSPESLSIIGAALANTFFIGRIYGQITSKLTTHESKHDRHERRLDGHDNTLQAHGEDISYLKGARQDV